MNQMVQTMTGMGAMTDQVIASDLLVSAKTGIKSYAIALTETATPQLREELKSQLNTAIEAHENIANYMISKGYYYPANMDEQLALDMKTSQTALSLPQE